MTTYSFHKIQNKHKGGTLEALFCFFLTKESYQFRRIPFTYVYITQSTLNSEKPCCHVIIALEQGKSN